jgi:hypothetical protein
MGSIHRVVDSGLPPTAPAHAAAFPWPAQRELAVVLYAPNVQRYVERQGWSAFGQLALRRLQITPQAAPSSGQPQPTSRTGRTGRQVPYRTCSNTQVLRGTPHALTVLVRDDGEPMEQCAEGGRGALERYRQISAGLSGAGEPGTGGMEGGAVLRNSLPVWNEGIGAFTLPFYSRAQLPSKKNFHIVRPESPDDILLLFGKHSKAGNLTSFSLDFCRPLSVLAAFGIALTAFGDSD